MIGMRGLALYLGRTRPGKVVNVIYYQGARH